MQEQDDALRTEEPALSASVPMTTRKTKKEEMPPTIDGVDALRAALATKRDAGSRLLGSVEILAAEDRKFRVVSVPEWGGEVIVRDLSGTERDAFEASIVRMKGDEKIVSTLNIRAKLCALSIVDPSDPGLSRRAFSDEQVAALGAKSAGALSRVYDVSADLSGISKDDTEELEKNLGKAASGDSSPKSP